jgi:ribosomal protein S12 methylthiotransferase accessory factor YcaO
MIKLHSSPKWMDGALPRTVAPEKTYQRLRPLMPSVGVTYVMELTPLDRLGIPICLATGSPDGVANLHEYILEVIPEAETIIDSMMSTIDQFSPVEAFLDMDPPLSAGKGLTPLDSRVSAMMEAVERFSGKQPLERPVVSSYREMKTRRDQYVVDPRSLMLISPSSFDEDREIEWVRGTDLFSGDEAWVPLGAATHNHPCQPSARIFNDTSTGLGAGNTIEEAVSHGLAETIEHDAWILVVARSAYASLERGVQKMLFPESAKNEGMALEQGEESESPFIRVDLESLEAFEPIRELLNHYHQAGVRVTTHDITSDIRIPVFSVAIDGMSGDLGGGGLGAHPDARLALIRALTEAAQQRLVLGLSRFRRTIPVPTWRQLPWDSGEILPTNGQRRSFHEIPSATNMDILQDIHTMLEALKLRGYEHAIAVDVTEPELDIPVVKVVVPGLVDFWTSDAPSPWATVQSRIQRYSNP